MLVLEDAIQDLIVNWVLHWVCCQFFKHITRAEGIVIGLTIVLDGIIYEGARYFQWFEQFFVGALVFNSDFFATVLMTFRTVT